MDPASFKMASTAGSALAQKLIDPKLPGARLVDKPVRLGTRIRFKWLNKQIAEKDVERLVRELLLRTVDADPRHRFLDDAEAQSLVDAIVQTMTAFGNITIDLAQAASLGPEKLATTLEAAAHTQLMDISPRAQSLYHVTLRLCCLHVIEHFTSLPQFQARTNVELAQDLRYIRDLLDRENELHTWTSSDISAGLRVIDSMDEDEPLERGERIDVGLLRQGRLPHLQRDFSDLAEVFDVWVAQGAQRKRGPERLRIFWVVGDPGPHRSKAYLACMSRAGIAGRIIYDAGRDLDLASQVLDRTVFAGNLHVPPLIGVDLAGRHSEDVWASTSNVMSRVRTRLSGPDTGSEPPIDPYPRLIIGGDWVQGQDAMQALEALAEFTAVDARGSNCERFHETPSENKWGSKTLDQNQVFIQGLPATTKSLYGREAELAALQDAWTSKAPNVLSIVAYGGTGKSSLVSTWLRNMWSDDYLGARRVFAWSFYSQGTRENLVSADPFISTALRWLGDEAATILSPVERGLRLADLVRQHRFLLVLDGVEPLQHPLGDQDVGGQFTDDSIRAFLLNLAKSNWDGLCVVTTRVPLTDLRRFETPQSPNENCRVQQLSLVNLDDESAAALLRDLTQTKAPFREIQAAVQDVGGHALALTLLGNYLRDVHSGDLNGRFSLDRLTIEESEGGHARRIMSSYARWLKASDRTAELAVLNVIGLFDRPAAPSAMRKILGSTDCKLLSGSLDSVGGPVWNSSVEALRGMGLLNPEVSDWLGTLDAHPLVREHFREGLRHESPEVWIGGNRCLYEFYKGQAQDQPADTRGMNMLYAAVTHGAGARLHQEVFDDVLLPRVWRDRRTIYSTRRLGMIGSDLVALSNYFQGRRWTELQDLSLSAPARVLILTNTGVRLRQLGRLKEARDSFGAVVRDLDARAAVGEELQDAAYAAAQYCELLVIAGMLTGWGDTALVNGEKAIVYADRGGEPYFRMHSRSSLAEVYFMLGDRDRAGKLFDEARDIDHEFSCKPRFLYSQGLFRYGYYLIESNKAEWILEEAERDDTFGTNGGDTSLLSQAIRLLVLGAAHRSRLEGQSGSAQSDGETEELLDRAVNEFYRAGYSDYTIRGLLERAHFYRARHLVEDYKRAIGDLDEARYEADRGLMDLLRADIFLERAACHLSFWADMSPTQRSSVLGDLTHALREGARLVTNLSYMRRRPLVAGLWSLREEQGIE